MESFKYWINLETTVMFSQEILKDSLQQVNLGLSDLSANFIHQDTIWDQIVGEFKGMMKSMDSSFQHLAICFEKLASAVLDETSLNISMDLSTTKQDTTLEQDEKCSTFLFDKLTTLLQDYGKK